jgi:gliding motility-associated lipoprotein GldH
MKQINRIFVGLMLAAFMLTGCGRNVVYSEYHDFKDAMWPAGEKAVFDVEITDTQSLNNISLMVRHADSYPYSNIFLFVTSKYPDGKVLVDTMEVLLANTKGEWQGSGAGDIFDLKVPVKRNIRFPLSGKYQFSFEQGMRVDPLPMVMDFGLEIEKVSK